MENDIMNVLMPYIIAIVTALGGYLTTRIVAYINAKKDSLAATTQSELLAKYIGIAGDEAVKVVQTLNEEVVNDLKAKSGDGKLTPEEITEIRELAVKKLNERLTESAKSILNSVGCDLNDYLNDLLIATVNEMKVK